MKLIVDLTDDAEVALRELERRAGFGATRKSVVCAALESAAESARRAQQVLEQTERSGS